MKEGQGEAHSISDHWIVVTEPDQVEELLLKKQELTSKNQNCFVQAWMVSMSVLPPPWVAASFFFHSFFCYVRRDISSLLSVPAISVDAGQWSILI